MPSEKVKILTVSFLLSVCLSHLMVRLYLDLENVGGAVFTTFYLNFLAGAVIRSMNLILINMLLSFLLVMPISIAVIMMILARILVGAPYLSFLELATFTFLGKTYSVLFFVILPVSLFSSFLGALIIEFLS